MTGDFEDGVVVYVIDSGVGGVVFVKFEDLFQPEQ